MGTKSNTVLLQMEDANYGSIAWEGNNGPIQQS